MRNPFLPLLLRAIQGCSDQNKVNNNSALETLQERGRARIFYCTKEEFEFVFKLILISKTMSSTLSSSALDFLGPLLALAAEPFKRRCSKRTAV